MAVCEFILFSYFDNVSACQIIESEFKTVCISLDSPLLKNLMSRILMSQWNCQDEENSTNQTKIFEIPSLENSTCFGISFKTRCPEIKGNDEYISFAIILALKLPLEAVLLYNQCAHYFNSVFISKVKVCLSRRGCKSAWSMILSELTTWEQEMDFVSCANFINSIPNCEKLIKTHFSCPKDELSPQLKDFLKNCISATFLAGGHVIILGNSTKSINTLILTLSMLLPDACLKYSVTCSSTEMVAPSSSNTISYLPGLFLQGILVDELNTADAKSFASHENPYPTAIIRLGAKNHINKVFYPESIQSHAVAHCRTVRNDLMDCWNGVETSKTPTTQSKITHDQFAKENHTLVDDFLTKLFLLPSHPPSIRYDFIQHWKSTFYAMALACFAAHSLHPKKSGNHLSDKSKFNLHPSDILILAAMGEILHTASRPCQPMGNRLVASSG